MKTIYLIPIMLLLSLSIVLALPVCTNANIQVNVTRNGISTPLSATLDLGVYGWVTNTTTALVNYYTKTQVDTIITSENSNNTGSYYLKNNPNNYYNITNLTADQYIKNQTSANLTSLCINDSSILCNNLNNSLSIHGNVALNNSLLIFGGNTGSTQGSTTANFPNVTCGNGYDLSATNNVLGNYINGVIQYRTGVGKCVSSTNLTMVFNESKLHVSGRVICYAIAGTLAGNSVAYINTGSINLYISGSDGGLRNATLIWQNDPATDFSIYYFCNVLGSG